MAKKKVCIYIHMYTWYVHRNIHTYNIDLHQQTISRSQGILLLMKLTKFSPPPLPQHSPLPQALLSLIKRQLVASQRTFCPWTLVCIFNNYQNCSIISQLKADLKCVSEETCFFTPKPASLNNDGSTLVICWLHSFSIDIWCFEALLSAVVHLFFPSSLLKATKWLWLIFL